MQELAESSEIPVSTDNIREALESAAIPGFTGIMQLNIFVRPEASACVMVGVIRRQSHKVGDEATVRQTLPDPTRKKPVQGVVEELKVKLKLRTTVTAVEARYLDGVLQNYILQS